MQVESQDLNPKYIREYRSTLYVGMAARKKMAAHTFQLQVMS